MDAGDLDARLHAMRLGNPSSSRQQPQYRAPPPPRPQQVLVPTAPPSLLPPPPVFEPFATPVVGPLQHPLQPPPQMLVPTVTPDMRMLQQQRLHVAPLSYSAIGSSTGAGFASRVGARSPCSVYASLHGACSPNSVYPSLYGAHSPGLNAAAAPFSPVAPKPSKLRANARDYHPVARSHPSAAQSSSAPSSSASQRLPQPGAAAAFPARYDNASPDPYASALLIAPRANHADSRLWSHAPAIGGVPALEQARDHLPSTKPVHVMLAESAEHVVHLLAKGGDRERLGVFAAVKSTVHRVMGSSEAHVVFLALLRACVGRYDELQGIVNAACNGKGFLMCVAQQEHGETALKELLRVVAPFPQLCAALIEGLIREGLMEQPKGAELLRHCFTTLPYNDCSIIIWVAIATIESMLSSAYGCRCLMECFRNARNGELRALEEIILSHTSGIAKGKYSNYFLQRVLRCGSEQLKEGVVEDFVGLSLDPAGSFVVQTCFLRTGSLAALQRVLAALLSLPDDQLAELVRGRNSNYVVRKLLRACQDRLPNQTLVLAWRIEKLPVAIRRETHAQRVMRVVKKQLTKQPLG